MTSSVRSVAVALAISLCACGGAGPRVNVLGVADAPAHASDIDEQTVMVFLEVVNPTKLELELSRLEYRFSAGAWLSVAGEARLSRSVAAGSTAVIEVPVTLGARVSGESDGEVAGAVPYSLDGRIFAVADRVQRSWSVAVRGQLSPEAVAAVRGASTGATRVADQRR